MERISVDICVIGGGSGGLSVAAGAAQLGASVALCEHGRMGGDCLNFGCVPSKSLLAAAEVAAIARTVQRFGVSLGPPAIDHRLVHEHVRKVIAAIAPSDSVERFTGLGVRVIEKSASFTGPREIRAGDLAVTARRFVIATGSSPAVPPIPGLDTVTHLTNETVFDLATRPRHLVVIGGGPIGCELAQAHRRLGADVSVIEMARIVPREDPELADFVRRSMVADGVKFFEGARVLRVERAGDDVVVVLASESGEQRIEGSHLLLATGRRPNVDGLNLEAAGVRFTPKGIAVDARLRTTNRRIFAIGDATGAYQFTHVANYHAGIVLRNALFRWPARVDYRALPWVTFTDPELARVGVSEEEARARHGSDIRILRWPFHDNDRAQAQHATEGLVKVVTTRKGRVLGAAIVGPHAGELLQPWVFAAAGRIGLRDIAEGIVAYPTLAEVNKRAAGSFFTPKLFSRWTRRLVRILARLG
jgi:pyruvate/2-oxoglutarate dehydrogenase complex dihydrolipoamide dehydrogenase (E3) component